MYVESTLSIVWLIRQELVLNEQPPYLQLCTRLNLCYVQLNLTPQARNKKLRAVYTRCKDKENRALANATPKTIINGDKSITIYKRRHLMLNVEKPLSGKRHPVSHIHLI